jgi:FkbM family methyltransferase
MGIKTFIKRHNFLYRPLLWGYKIFSLNALEPKQKVLLKYQQEHPSVFFVQIGSNDGKSNDPLNYFIVKKKWKGVLVEPVRSVFSLLKENYAHIPSLIFENVAISDHNGKTKFYRIKTEGADLPQWYTQLGSFNKSVLLSHEKHIPNIQQLIIEEEVEVVTIQDLLNKHKISRVNVLHIDTEGYDYEIIKTINFSTLRIDILIFEHIHLSEEKYKECMSLLTNNNYVLFKFGDDTLCLTSGLKNISLYTEALFRKMV